MLVNNTPIICPATQDYLGYPALCSQMPNSILFIHTITIMTEAIFNVLKGLENDNT